MKLAKFAVSCTQSAISCLTRVTAWESADRRGRRKGEDSAHLRNVLAPAQQSTVKFEGREQYAATVRRLEMAEEEIRSLCAERNLWRSQVALMLAVNALPFSCPVDCGSGVSVEGNGRKYRSPL